MHTRIDLHMHSRHSNDGEKTPAELVAMAVAAGMDCIALADHNRVDGVDEAMRAAGATLRVIPAVELDCIYDGLSLHILGYCIDHHDAGYAEVWNDVSTREQAASETLMQRVEACGIALDREKALAASRDGIVTAESIAEIALADPRNQDNALLTPFRPGGARSDNPYVNFYWDFCSQGKPAHVPVEFMPFADAIDLIRRTGGVPVLAHPGQSLRTRRDALPELARNGVRGVEAYSSYHAPEDNRHWAEQAKENALIVTCGSDYHGKTKPAIEIGGHGCAEDGLELEQALRAAAKK